MVLTGTLEIIHFLYTNHACFNQLTLVMNFDISYYIILHMYYKSI